MNRRLLIVGVAFVLVGALMDAPASDTIPAPPQTKPTALKGATIHPLSAADIPSGTIVFENGKITALGVDVPVPAGAEVIDATGKHVYPGLINANTVLGLVEIGVRQGRADVLLGAHAGTPVRVLPDP